MDSSVKVTAELVLLQNTSKNFVSSLSLHRNCVAVASRQLPLSRRRIYVIRSASIEFIMRAHSDMLPDAATYQYEWGNDMLAVEHAARIIKQTQWFQDALEKALFRVDIFCDSCGMFFRNAQISSCFSTCLIKCQNHCHVTQYAMILMDNSAAQILAFPPSERDSTRVEKLGRSTSTYLPTIL